jgi:hypothetical protein
LVLQNVLKNEKILPDNYPVYWDYCYICDGKVIRSDIQGTVADLKKDLRSQGYKEQEIKNCDIFARQKNK